MARISCKKPTRVRVWRGKWKGRKGKVILYFIAGEGPAWHGVKLDRKRDWVRISPTCLKVIG